MPAAPTDDLAALLRLLDLGDFIATFEDEELTLPLLRSMRADLLAESLEEVGLSAQQSDRLCAALGGRTPATTTLVERPPEQFKIHISLGAELARSRPQHQLKMTLPTRWLSEPVDQITESFGTSYAAKFGADALPPSSELALEMLDRSPFSPTSGAWRMLRPLETPTSAMRAGEELRVGARAPAASSSAAGGGGGAVRCKNYGCQCEFEPAANHDGACRHHAQAPLSEQKATPHLSARRVARRSA